MTKNKDAKRKGKIRPEPEAFFHWIMDISIATNDQLRLDVFKPRGMDGDLKNQCYFMADKFLPMTASTHPTLSVPPLAPPTTEQDVIKLLAETLTSTLPTAKYAAPITPASKWPHQIAILLRIFSVKE